VGTRTLTLQEDLIRAREDLRFQATHDVLTGIWNRRAVLDLLHREIVAVSASPIFAASSEISVSVSVGATATAGGAETEVLAIADSALYEAKGTGRNRTVVR
jgi:GGDEF domain-containing protein